MEETADEVGKYIAMGYLAVRAQTGIPGLPSTYGVAKDKLFYEPAEKGLPPENVWSTEKYLLHAPRLFEALDRKSTRLNSSHGYISYAVFCLKKKTQYA